MTERLTDEQVHQLCIITSDNRCTTPDEAYRALREVQDLRRLVYGGTCPDCGGNGLLMCEHEDECPLDCWMTKPCPNRSCVSGRTPGLADRLEAMLDRMNRNGEVYYSNAEKSWLTSVIADLRKAAP